MATSLASTLAAVHLPGLSDLLGLDPLPAADLALVAAVAVVPAMLVEAARGPAVRVGHSQNG